MFQAYKTVLRETLLLEGRQWNQDGEMNEEFCCSPSSSQAIVNANSEFQPFCHGFSLSLSDYKAFQEASERFQPYIKFFATFDKSVSLNL